MSKVPAAKLKENVIRYIGNHPDGDNKVWRRLPEDFHTAVGADDYEHGIRIVEQLAKKNLVEIKGKVEDLIPNSGGGWRPQSVLHGVSLTLDGQEEYERYQGESSGGGYGFVALQFDNAKVEQLMDAIKPKVRSELGCELVDLRDVERPGIIDNIMCETIEGATFVVADLTDGNQGAYWEAGYAE